MNPDDRFAASIFKCDDDLRHGRELIAAGEAVDPYSGLRRLGT